MSTRAMTTEQLAREHDSYAVTGGVSGNNRSFGFRPAFFNGDTKTIHLSRDRTGNLTPYHCLDGLPQELVEARDPHGRVIAVKPAIQAGFERGGVFYTRDEAVAVVSQEKS